MSRSLEHTKPIVTALRRSALFQHVPLRQLTALAEKATELHLQQGELVYDEGSEANAFYVVRGGRLQDFARDAQGKLTIRRQLRPGDTFGETAVVLGQATRSRVMAGDGAVLACLKATDLHLAMAESTAFRRALLSAAHPELESVVAAATQHEDVNVELVAIHGPDGWPLEKLTRALGEALVRNHGDRVGIVHVVATAPDPLGPVPPADQDGLVHVTVGPDPDAFLDSALAVALRKEMDYLLLDLTAADAEASANWAAHATKLASLRLPGDVTPLPGLRDSVRLCESVLMPETGISVRPHVLPVGAARVRLNQKDLDQPISAWSEGNRRALDKWARNVSDRTVGLALGGGGAWGYAHVALIEELLARNIPIDIVAGVSFGSMVGAYYCVAGEEGLRKLVKAGPRLAFAVQGAIINSSVIGMQVKWDVGDHWLEDLDTVFLPVACDIAAAETTAIRGINVALGTTASGSFPTVFGPTTTMDPVAGKLRRYVDGGISDNVPDGPILSEGADLVIASNIVPPPRSEPAPKPMFPGRIGALLQGINPIQRSVDGYRSTFMLFHTAGNSEQLIVDAIMETKPTSYLPIEFGRATDIIAESRALAQATADRALLRWQAMQGRNYVGQSIQAFKRADA